MGSTDSGPVFLVPWPLVEKGCNNQKCEQKKRLHNQKQKQQFLGLENDMPFLELEHEAVQSCVSSVY